MYSDKRLVTRNFKNIKTKKITKVTLTEKRKIFKQECPKRGIYIYTKLIDEIKFNLIFRRFYSFIYYQ